jgi:excinuclease ABC subunit A
VIKSSDWLTDLGLEGDTAGGQIIVEYRPEQVANVATSYTGRRRMDDGGGKDGG